ncbi:MAG: hypothetical protein JNK04_16480, partial [Myxococcales bacterium]|nr:hypothetical protein [Myxococcales bacterium]
ALINKACATDRNLRFATAAELAAAIDGTVMINAPLYLAGPPSLSRDAIPRAPVSSSSNELETLVQHTPSSGSQPSMPTPSQPSSVAGASVPGFSSAPGFGSQPSFHSYVSRPGVVPAGDADRANDYADLRSNGTAVISLPDRPWESQPGASQPSFAQTQGLPPGATSQPGFQSQPSFQGQPGFQSQPSFQSQPGAASQPSFGSGSQPSMSASSGSISVGGATAGPMTMPQSAEPPRRNTAAIFAVVFAAVLGVGGALLYFLTIRPHPPAAASASSASSAASASATATATLVVSNEAPPVPSASSSPPPPSASQPASATPSAKPTVRVGPRPRPLDPGY